MPISICAKAPNWYSGLQYKKLAPTFDILMKYKKDGDEESYVKCFEREVLQKLNNVDVIKELSKLSNMQDVVLLCYEKAGDFCHRHLVAQWLRERIKVGEWRKGI